ncbi:MAG: hypothetical protein RIQ33_435 [Bacteroidota bacterium]|jgi:hypothetical protein
MKNLIVIVSVFLFFESCYDKKAYRILIKNNSNRILFASYDYNYPDTLIHFEHNPSNEVNSNSEFELLSKHKFEKEISSSGGKKICIFLYSNDTLIKYGWDKLKANNIILKRYDWSFQELKNNNFTIVYPQ